MKSGLFVIGTDTGVGKTWVSCGVLVALRRRGVRVAAMKPVASGCDATDVGLRNADALNLQARMTITADYATVNPYAYEPAIAPDIAARRAGRAIDPHVITACHAQLAKNSDCVVVEGVGGWRVPLGGGLELSALAKAFGHPLLLVVGMRLGCINHARLTVESLQGTGLPVAGWIANEVDPDFVAFEETKETLAQQLPIPLLASLHWCSDADSYAETHAEEFSRLGKICCPEQDTH